MAEINPVPPPTDKPKPPAPPPGTDRPTPNLAEVRRKLDSEIQGRPTAGRAETRITKTADQSRPPGIAPRILDSSGKPADTNARGHLDRTFPQSRAGADADGRGRPGEIPDVVGKAPNCEPQSHHSNEHVTDRSNHQVTETLNKAAGAILEAVVVPVVERIFGGSSASGPTNATEARNAPERQSYLAQAGDIAVSFAPVPGSRALGQLGRSLGREGVRDAERGLTHAGEKAATQRSAEQAARQDIPAPDRRGGTDRHVDGTPVKVTETGESTTEKSAVPAETTPGKHAANDTPAKPEPGKAAEHDRTTIAAKNAEGDALSAASDKALKAAMADTRQPVAAESLGRIGTVSDRGAFRAEVTKAVSDPQHPLHFLVESGKLERSTARGMDQAAWRDSPSVIEAGHITSGKSLADGTKADRFVVMSAHHNRLISATVEHPSMGAWMANNPALLIGGVPVDPATAGDWVAAGLLKPDVLAAARHVAY